MDEVIDKQIRDVHEDQWIKNLVLEPICHWSVTVKYSDDSIECPVVILTI